ncbi:unnamed protein product, partial [Bubo scandiacus]
MDLGVHTCMLNVQALRLRGALASTWQLIERRQDVGNPNERGWIIHCAEDPLSKRVLDV